jgi:hypothetical protein
MFFLCVLTALVYWPLPGLELLLCITNVTLASGFAFHLVYNKGVSTDSIVLARFLGVFFSTVAWKWFEVQRVNAF